MLSIVTAAETLSSATTLAEALRTIQETSMFSLFHPLRLRAQTFFLSLTMAASVAFAAFPDKPIRLVVPFAPGGGTDLIARTLAAGMSKELGQQVIIDNKPGAGTIIGTDNVAKSPADGYSIVIATFAHAINPSMVPKLPYAYDKAFAPITLIGKGPNVLVVRADSPYKSVKDVLAAARATPGKLTYASQGNGTSAHLAGEMFTNLAKVEMIHVPYRGAGPAMTDLLGGQVDMIFGTAAAVSTFIDSGKLRAIGVTSATPSNAFKGVPPIADTVPGYQVESWYGLYAPAGTPPEVIAKLNAVAKMAAHSPEFSKKIEKEGLTVVASDPRELDRYVKAEEARWRKIVKENNIKAD
jgi:tripartite-type tricarboxylate transporter receptor subunit TctC